MTLYWFSSDDTTDKDNPFEGDLGLLIGIDVVIALIIFAVLFSGLPIRRQAKPGTPFS